MKKFTPVLGLSIAAAMGGAYLMAKKTSDDMFVGGVAGFCSDKEYYAVIPRQGPTMFPGMVQRWAIVRRTDSVVDFDDKDVLQDDDERIEQAARHFIMNAMSIVGANSWTHISDLRVTGWTHGVPDSIMNAPQHIKKVPEFHSSTFSDRQVSVVTIMVEFYFEGSVAQFASKDPVSGRQWPWYVGGVTGAFPCPEDMHQGGGLLAVLTPEEPPLHQITPIEEMVSPLKDLINDTHDFIQAHGPTLPEIPDSPADPTTPFGMMLWGGAGILLLNLYNATKSRSSKH